MIVIWMKRRSSIDCHKNPLSEIISTFEWAIWGYLNQLLKPHKYRMNFLNVNKLGWLKIEKTSINPFFIFDVDESSRALSFLQKRRAKTNRCPSNVFPTRGWPSSWARSGIRGSTMEADCAKNAKSHNEAVQGTIQKLSRARNQKWPMDSRRRSAFEREIWRAGSKMVDYCDIFHVPIWC